MILLIHFDWVNACIQAVWLQGILSDFDLGSTFSTVLFCDNKSAINISTDPVTRKRTKHVEIQMHFIRELVHDRTIILQYFPTNEQIADIFSKRFLENTVHLPPFTVGGEFISVIQTTFSVQLEGGFSHWVFPLFLT